MSQAAQPKKCSVVALCQCYCCIVTRHRSGLNFQCAGNEEHPIRAHCNPRAAHKTQAGPLARRRPAGTVQPPCDNCPEPRVCRLSSTLSCGQRVNWVISCRLAPWCLDSTLIKQQTALLTLLCNLENHSQWCHVACSQGVLHVPTRAVLQARLCFSCFFVEMLSCVIVSAAVSQAALLSSEIVGTNHKPDLSYTQCA